jgi:hypothetical protein
MVVIDIIAAVVAIHSVSASTHLRMRRISVRGRGRERKREELLFLLTHYVLYWGL